MRFCAITSVISLSKCEITQVVCFFHGKAIHNVASKVLASQTLCTNIHEVQIRFKSHLFTCDLTSHICMWSLFPHTTEQRTLLAVTFNISIGDISQSNVIHLYCSHLQCVFTVWDWTKEQALPLVSYRSHLFSMHAVDSAMTLCTH